MSVPTVTRYPARTEWLEGRKSGARFAIGGSTVAAVMGRSPWAGPWEVYCEHYCPEALPQRDEPGPGDVRTRGHVVEPWLVEQWAAATINDCDAGLLIVQHHEHKWARFSPDGVVYSDAGRIVGVVECKTFSFRDRSCWADPLTDAADQPIPAVDHIVQGDQLPAAVEAGTLPDKYLYQVLWAFVVTGCEWVDLVAAECGYQHVRTFILDDGTAITSGGWTVEQDRPVVIRITRPTTPVADASDYADWTFRRVAEWRERHLVNGEEPDPDASEACKRAMLAKLRPGESEATADALEQASAYTAARDAEKAAKAEKARTANLLLAAMGDSHTILNADGGKVAYVLTDKRGRKSLRVS